jgi:DNA-binding CsgD family transcriptional regulator
VNGRKRNRVAGVNGTGLEVDAKIFVFFDKSTNTKRFEVRADRNGKLPVEETVSLLAMQCVVRGQTPDDFRVLVSAEEDILIALLPRTNKLIQACMSSVLPVALSPRQKDVLRGILQNLSNKEIACKLNIAERTVKFHVSALLRKFEVQGRGALMQKAGDLLSEEGLSTRPVSAARRPVPIASVNPPKAGLGQKLLRLTSSERRAVSR